MNKNILWIDTETTGLDADKHGIVEIGIIIDINGKIENKIRSTMRPTGRLADDRALEVNGFTRDRIRNLYPWENVYVPVMDHISMIGMDHAIYDSFFLGGQNVGFDNRFMCSWQKQCGSTTKNDWSAIVNQDSNTFIDTQKVFKELKKTGFVPESESTKLGNICKYFGVSLENAHTAMGDIEATREVYYKMMECFK